MLVKINTNDILDKQIELLKVRFSAATASKAAASAALGYMSLEDDNKKAMRRITELELLLYKYRSLTSQRNIIEKELLQLSESV